MTIRRLAVFSGFDGRVVERLRPQLESQQTMVVVVKLPQRIDEEYFDRLFSRMADLLNKVLRSDDELRIIGLLVSCLNHDEEIRVERDVFFPILRRLAVGRTFRSDVSKASTLAGRVSELFGRSDFLNTYQWVKPSVAPLLSLPTRNAKSPRLVGELDKLYDLMMFEPSRALERYVQRLKGQAGLRSRGVDFCGCTNNAQHPVRRVTDSLHCDIAGRMRLGFSLPARFEFDVSCSTGLGGKYFHTCGGEQLKVPAGTSHLNMRINDDFAW